MRIFGIISRRPSTLRMHLAELVAGYGPQQLYLLTLAALTITLIGLYQAGESCWADLVPASARRCSGRSAPFSPTGKDTNRTRRFSSMPSRCGAFTFLCRLDSAPSWSLACAFGAAIGIASLYKQVVVAPAALLGLVYILGSGPDMKSRWLAVRYMLVAAGVSLVVLGRLRCLVLEPGNLRGLLRFGLRLQPLLPPQRRRVVRIV